MNMSWSFFLIGIIKFLIVETKIINFFKNKLRDVAMVFLLDIILENETPFHET